MKPKFLLSGGTNFSASTPFFYTLAVDQQYCHTGHMKEMHYLHLTESGWDGYRERLTAIPITNRDDEKKPPMLKQWRWDTSEMSEYFQPPFTIEKYIKYHLHHWWFGFVLTMLSTASLDNWFDYFLQGIFFQPQS